MSPNPDAREVHTRSMYLSKSFVRYERWDRKYGTCMSGEVDWEDVREGMGIIAIQKDVT
jgi:hypothetical protein